MGIKELEDELDILKKEQAEEDKKAKLKKEIRELKLKKKKAKDAQRISNKVFNFLKEWADNME